MTTQRYRGSYPVGSTAGPGTVVREDANGVWTPLDPRYDLRNHSPTGFAWGYGGSGPSQLALAILFFCELRSQARRIASVVHFLLHFHCRAGLFDEIDRRSSGGHGANHIAPHCA